MVRNISVKNWNAEKLLFIRSRVCQDCQYMLQAAWYEPRSHPLYMLTPVIQAQTTVFIIVQSLQITTYFELKPCINSN